MAARAGEPCPDPSAHGHSHKLSEQASTAALYVTDPTHRNSPKPAGSPNPLGPDGRLSSASAAASLKYARPQDLPSFPSAGLAANSAGRAALQAQDVKVKGYQVPEASSAGSKAALMAHKKGPELDLWQPSASKDGNSAALLAMRAKGLSPELDRGYTEDGKNKALLAATKSIHKRPESETQSSPSPALYPDQKNSAFNALNAATVSHKASVRSAPAGMMPDGWDSQANQAARIKNSHINPEMFSERPPVDIEQDEIKYQSALRASAVSMAKQMYDYQNRSMLEPSLTGGKAGADAAAARIQPQEQVDMKQEALKYIHLQDAAQKLAQERLAKVDKNFEAAKYREYYGYPDAQPGRRNTLKMSMRNTNRRRAGSEANAGDGDDSSDEEKARKIRTQMSQLNSGLSSVDDKKRTDDRAKLLAAAEKKVSSQMNTMDQKVFSETGKVPPSILEDWEKKARAKAEADRELASKPENKGKTHIGGGKFMDQSELDAIAAARLKSTLEEISDTAEKRRAHDEAMRIEADKQHTKKMEERMQKQKEKDEWKAHRQYDKDQQRAAKLESLQRSRAEEERVKKEQAAARAEARPSVEGGDVTGGEAETPKQDPKRQSMRGRVRTLWRGNKDEQKPEPDQGGIHAGTATAAGVGAGAAAGGVATKEATDETTDRSKSAEDKDMEDREAAEQKELDEEEPAVADPVAEANAASETSSDGEEDTERVNSKLKPNLERHITHDLDSSDSDDGFEVAEDDDDSDDSDVLDDTEKTTDPVELLQKNKSAKGDVGSKHEEEAGDLGKKEAHRVADRVGTAPTGDDAEYETNEAADKTLPEKVEHGEASDVAVADKGSAVAAASTIVPKLSEQKDAKKDAAPASETVAASKSEPANKVEAKTKADSNRLSKPKESPVKTEPEGREKKKRGLSGFFNKLRNRDSRSEGDTSSKSTPYSEVKSAEKTTEKPTEKPTEKLAEKETAESTDTPNKGSAVAAGTTGKESPSTDQPTSTDGPTSSDQKISPSGSNASTSSFKRHETDPTHPDDVSSSGVEEDDLNRGRAGSGAASRRLSNKQTAAADDNGEDDEDQFYESTDHFDSGALAPPTFTASKSESPSRATKFVEDV